MPAHDANPLREGLPRTRAPEPCAIVLFGATGDLTQRKLVPALYRLAVAGHLPAECAAVGFARRDWSDDQFRAEMRAGLDRDAPADFEQTWPEFSGRLSYCRGNFDEPDAYDRLREQLERIDATHGTRGNRLYYLAVAPEYFATIIENLGRAGLVCPPRQDDGPWSRVVIEKPFGHDPASARALNRDVSRVLDETQVYRIDHYLGKETVQNILALRFGNTIFESLWNRQHVASVQITMAEDVGMAGGRGGYYDTAGAIRDMVQNHMMQLLCLVAMEPPVNLSADSVRTEKVKVLEALPRWSAEDVARNVVRGQYAAGSIQGADAPGYHQEKGIPAESTTETYVAMRLTVDNWRWAGVPFYVRTGKRLPKRTTEIALEFRRPPTPLFEPEAGDGGVNQLVLRIQPNEGASLGFQAKVPGSRRRLQEVRMDFRYGTAFAVPPPEAYERLLLDVMLGDPTLFTRTDEVDAAWRFVGTILDAWSSGAAGPPEPYLAGTWGPDAADALLARDGAKWRRP